MVYEKKKKNEKNMLRKSKSEKTYEYIRTYINVGTRLLGQASSVKKLENRRY
jgi:hypothetical protein